MGIQTTDFELLDMTCLAARTVPAEVRQRIGLRLAAWGLEGLGGDVRLVATELVANACAETPQGRIRVRFTRQPDGLLLAVWDGGDRMPHVRPVRQLEPDDLDLSEDALDRNGGWGLQLVEALSRECGVNRTYPNGKWVWAGWRCEPEPEADDQPIEP